MVRDAQASGTSALLHTGIAMKKTLALCLAAGMLLIGSRAHSQSTFSGAAFDFDPTPVQVATDSFRTALGGGFEINWDDVPHAFSSPNPFPADFYSARGARFATPGIGFEVSTDPFNPFFVLFDFGNIDPEYPFLFEPLSPQRMFTPRASNITDVDFFLPGTTTPALTTGFGAVFSDVNVAGSTSMEFFDVNGISLGKYDAPAIPGNDENFSFIGVDFDAPIVSRVRIVTGNLILGPGILEPDIFDDLVVMDNLIYGPLVDAAPVIPAPEPGTISLLFMGLVALLRFGGMTRNEARTISHERNSPRSRRSQAY